MKTIIALTGPKGSGKSTLASLLEESPYLDHSIARLSFAGSLKEMLAIILPPEAFLPENKENEAYGLCGRTPRHIMQTLGTEWGRMKIAKDLWVEVLKKKIKKSRAKTIIVDDLRFENEAQMLSELGAVIVRVDRPGYLYSGEHASEEPIPSSYIDVVIPNRSKQDLVAIVKTWNPEAYKPRNQEVYK